MVESQDLQEYVHQWTNYELFITFLVGCVILYNQSIVTFFFPIIFAPALCALLWEISDHFRLSESIHCSIYHYVKEYATLV